MFEINNCLFCKKILNKVNDNISCSECYVNGYYIFSIGKNYWWLATSNKKYLMHGRKDFNYIHVSNIEKPYYKELFQIVYINPEKIEFPYLDQFFQRLYILNTFK